MNKRLETSEQILAFCRQSRQVPPERRGDALAQIMGIDWDQYPKEVSDAADDAEFFLCFGAERDGTEETLSLAESKVRQDKSSGGADAGTPTCSG